MDATLAEEVSQARHAREQAERLRADASAQTRRTVRQLRERGMAQRDISALLGISRNFALSAAVLKNCPWSLGSGQLGAPCERMHLA